jgi:pyridoxal phosphate enzyme (YggS family)
MSGAAASDSVAEIAQRVAAIRERIEIACERSGRSPDSVTLIGASKVQSPERLRAAFEAGLRVFGENRVQEAASKRELLPEIEHWCLIGALQGNKVHKAVELFESVHSVDRLKIAFALDRSARQRGRQLEAFLEINLGGESTKSGFDPEDLRESLRPLADLEALRIVGLMTIPPPSDDLETARGYFRQLRELRDEVFAGSDWSDRPGCLSMGMSGDFELAIEEGSTHVRVGTALFGQRFPKEA